MTTDAVTLPRKKPSIFWWIGALFLLLFGLFLYQLFGPNPKIILSKQTTYITSPLRPDGMPNYGQYLLESSRNGIIPENNAASLMWRAMGLDRIDAKDRAAFAAELGISGDLSGDHPLEPPYSAQTRQRVAAWLSEQGKLTLPGQTIDNDTIKQLLKGAYQYSGDSTQIDRLNDLIDDVIDRASMSPWTSKQYPPLAAWVADNQASLDLLVAASNRPQFYSPWPALLHGESSLGAGIPLDAVQNYREIARALPVRAMWYAGEGRTIEAWHDLQALHRLAGFCAGHTFVEYLVAIAMSDIACRNTLTLLGNPNLSADEARQILHDLTAIPPFPSMADCVDHGERIVSIGMILEVVTSGGGFAMLADSPSDPASSGLLSLVTVDWNIVLTDLNYWFDQLTAALHTAGPAAARSAAVDQVFANIRTAQSDAWTKPKLMASVVSRRQRSRLVATTVVDLVTPALQSVIAADNRANTKRSLTRLAAALAVYRAEHAAYPEKLADLAPEILTTLPVDFYHGKPFIYARTSDGYLLYSLGENGTDDGGSNEQQNIFEGNELNDVQSNVPSATQSKIPPGADDISIRIPVTPFKLPAPKPAE